MKLAIIETRWINFYMRSAKVELYYLNKKQC